MKKFSSRILLMALVTIPLVLMPPPAGAQWIQTATLTASDGQANDAFGLATANNGNTLVVGAPARNHFSGAAYVFTQSNGVWTQVAELIPSDSVGGQFFGGSVAIANGNTIVVGADATAAFVQGAAYVFVKPASGWTNMTETAKLTPSDGNQFDEFGFSVAAFNNTIVVGAPQHQVGSNQYQGTAYIFVEPGAGWTSMTQSAELTASDGVRTDNLGIGVAMQGSTVVAGSALYNSLNGAGAAYVFEEPISGWTDEHETAKLTATDPSQFAFLGFSLAISADEATIVAGAPRRGDSGVPYGSSYIFSKPAAGWHSATQTSEMFAPGQARQFGTVAINPQGTLVAVGAAWTNDKAAKSGSAYIYRKPAGGWPPVPKVQAKLTQSPPQAQANFGQGIGLRGTVALVGADGATVNGSSGQGAVYVFKHQ